MAEQWNVENLLELVRGFQPACIIIAAAELDVFTKLRRRPAAAGELAARLHADPRGMAILLDALAALGLLTKGDGGYQVPAGVADVLAEGSAGCALGMVRHQGNCLRRWDQLARAVLTGQPAQREPSVRGAAEDLAAFIRAMHEISGPMAGPLVAALGPLKFAHLLDIGGGSGTWTIPFLAEVPAAKATIFDLPEVVPMARERMARAGLAGRVRLVAGDFMADPLPGGADLAWLSAIVHQNSRAQNRALFANIFKALMPAGRIFIRDIVMDESRTGPPMGALFAVNMLVATAGGGTFTFDELAADLKAAGFADARFLLRGQAMDSVVAATKPSR